jgi:hypothetical protein
MRLRKSTKIGRRKALNALVGFKSRLQGVLRIIGRATERHAISIAIKPQMS